MGDTFVPPKVGTRTSAGRRQVRWHCFWIRSTVLGQCVCMLSCTVPCRAMQCFPVLCSAMLSWASLSCTSLNSNETRVTDCSQVFVNTTTSVSDGRVRWKIKNVLMNQCFNPRSPRRSFFVLRLECNSSSREDFGCLLNNKVLKRKSDNMVTIECDQVISGLLTICRQLPLLRLWSVRTMVCVCVFACMCVCVYVCVCVYTLCQDTGLDCGGRN